MTKLYYCDHYEIPLPEGHKFPMRKYRLTRDVQCAPLASREDIELAHGPVYVEQFLRARSIPARLAALGFLGPKRW